MVADIERAGIDFYVTKEDSTLKMLVGLTSDDKLVLGKGISYDDAALMLASRGLNIEDYELEKDNG